jgi:hypothetical protein
MTRKIVHLTLAAARKSDLVADWTRLGFTVDAQRGCFSLADGVCIDFFAPNDLAPPGVEDLQARALLAHFAARRNGAALVSLSGEESETVSARAEPLFGAECYLRLAAPRVKPAPMHANGAAGLLALVALTENPADHAEALAALTGQREMLATSAGLEIRLAGGQRLDVLTAPAFAFRFGVPAPDHAGFRIAGMVFSADNLQDTETLLEQTGVDVKNQAGRLMAGSCEGVAVAFEQD